MRKYIAAAVLAFSLAVPAVAADEVSPERLALAKQMIELSGANKVYDNFDKSLDAMLNQMRQNMPNLDEQSMADIKKMAVEEFTAYKPELMDGMAKLYARHFSERDLRALITFYHSDAGKHFAAETPALSQESVALFGPFYQRFMVRMKQYFDDKKAAEKATDDKNTSKDK